MQKAAQNRGLDCEIVAYPEADMAVQVNDCDVALLGPQMGFVLNQAKELCGPKNVPVEVIPMLDYGMMNGEKVLDFALNLIP